MLHRLCEPPSIPLSFSLATILPRRGTYHFCYTWDHTGRPQASAHRLQLGLPGYLIPFAPLAFAPQRQLWTREPPSPPVFLRGISPDTYDAAYVRFKPSNSEQRLHSLYYRGCWHRVSQCFLSSLRQSTALFVLYPS